MRLAGDDEPLEGAELERHAAILQSAWAAFAAAAARHADEPRKGPRGGGRDLPKIVGHVRRRLQREVYASSDKRTGTAEVPG